MAPDSREAAGILLGYLKEHQRPHEPEYAVAEVIETIPKLTVDQVWLADQTALLLADPRPLRRARAARVLGFMGQRATSAAGALAGLLGDSEPTWMRFPEEEGFYPRESSMAEIAAWALGRMGPAAKQFVPQIRQALQIKGGPTRTQIEAALAKIDLSLRP